MSNTYILHAGVKGMRWGVRRYQNPDGTLTEAGKKRYGRSGTTGGDSPDVARNQSSGRTKKNHRTAKERTAKAVVKGAEIASKLALASAADDIFYDGMGKKIAKETVKQTGRAVVTAYTMARGGYDIRWYDN